MEERRVDDTLMNLAEAAAIQDELVQYRLGIEWARTLLDRLLRTWMQLEIHEGMAYEDKVRSQVILVNEAMTSLSDLHKSLGRFSLQLKDHQRRLGRMNDSLEL